MVFSSLTFLFLFFPLVMVLYYALPWRGYHNMLLLVFSLVFYAWGEPVYIVLMLLSSLAAFLGGLLMERFRQRKTARMLTFVVTAALITANLLVFKYLNFFCDNLSALLGMEIAVPQLRLPIGISFYTFQILSYVIDLYWGKIGLQRSYLDLTLYVSFFPQLIAGPIVRYSDIAMQLQNRAHSWNDAMLGIRRFLVGLGKKVILADNFALLIELFRKSQEPSVLFYWMYAIAFTLNIYFDFSGYSDMAIGLGRIFGFHFIENFNYPYLSKSVTEFWRRWHMSLGSWFRDYVYIPLGGNRVSKARWIFNIFTVWMLTGLWHGAAWNFVLWGLLFAVLLLIEKWIPAIEKLPAVLRHSYVLLAVMLSFVLFNAQTLSQAGSDLGAMFGFAGLPVVSAQTIYYLKSYGLLFCVGFVGATPLVKNTASRLDQTKAGAVLEVVMLIGLLLVCTAYLVDGSFSPFLYFRF